MINNVVNGVLAGVEIFVAPLVMQQVHAQLIALSGEIQATKTQISFSNAQGKTVQEIIQLANEINQTSDHLSKIVLNAATATQQSLDIMTQTDNRLAGQFSK